MAYKKKAEINPTGKIVVKSRAYGKHERAVRAKSKAILNPAMKAHGRRLRKSTIPAKLIMDAIQPFRENFPGGMLWQKLVKHFAAQAKKDDDYNIAGIEHWDLNDRYPTSSIMSAHVEIKPADAFSNLKVSVNYGFSKRFLQRKKDITAFRITMIFLFPDFKKNQIRTIPVILPDKLLSDSALYEFIVPVPKRANSYLACFKAEACKNGELYNNAYNLDKAMCLMKSGVRD